MKLKPHHKPIHHHLRVGKKFKEHTISFIIIAALLLISYLLLLQVE